MYFDDMKQHNIPHIHIQYAEHKAIYKFEGICIGGKIPNKQSKMVEAWILIHKDELKLLWKLMQENNEFFSIDPLR